MQISGKAPMDGLSFETLTRNVRWQDAIDIALLSVLFSAAYRVMRRTVALQVGLGLSAFVCAWLVANRLGLILTVYLLSGLGTVATIIIVVLFQHEIRLAIGRANPLRWLSRRRLPVDTPVIVAEAAFTIAGHGKGALIVIPRRDPIFEHATSMGATIDARASAHLIEAIFTSSSPLHDGALVIDQERVLRAGVVLPLAVGGVEPKRGTRHRAALGMARLTDALIVCVSEEDGTVSLICDGSIEVMPDATRLERALRRLGDGRGHTRDATERFRPLRLLRALPYLGILAAVALAWSLLALNRSQVVVRVVPLEMRGLGEALSFEALRPISVTVELRGSEHEFESLSDDEIHAYVDLSKAALGSRRYRVRTESPVGFEVSSVKPMSVQLEIRPRPRAPPSSP
jgi:DNA integrity scanning protein DisA with diadenylate cyclase activity